MKTVFESRASTVIYNLAQASGSQSDVYLLPANVCYVVPLALLLAHQSFEFIDIAESHLCMDEHLACTRIQSKSLPDVCGVVYVRTYGADNNAEAFFRKLKSLNEDILIIDDRCAARPEPNSNLIDTQQADAVLYSTGYAKYVDLGFGGFAHMRKDLPYESHIREFASNDEKLITTLLKKHINESKPLYEGSIEGSECPLLQYAKWLNTTPPKASWDDYCMQIISARDSSDKCKAANNIFYEQSIPHDIQLPPLYQSWRFNVRVSRKSMLLDKIFAAGCFASGHYFPAATLFGAACCPAAASLYSEIVNLFNDRYVTREQVRKVAAIVSEHTGTSDIPGTTIHKDNAHA